MDCAEFLFSGHALRRMFERVIAIDDVVAVIRSGDVIEEYPADQPFPSFLMLGFRKDEAIHTVIGRDESGRCHIITVYLPDPTLWSDDFRTRR